MTDHIDYTTKLEVLAACGWCFDESEEEWVKGDRGVAFGAVCCDEMPVLTMKELWEGLCKVIPFNKQWPHLVGQYAAVLYYGFPEEQWFIVVDYGTLNNCIAAALYTVLQQSEKKEE